LLLVHTEKNLQVYFYLAASSLQFYFHCATQCRRWKFRKRRLGFAVLNACASPGDSTPGVFCGQNQKQIFSCEIAWPTILRLLTGRGKLQKGGSLPIVKTLKEAALPLRGMALAMGHQVNPKHQTLIPYPKTLNPKHYTLNPNP